MRSVSQCDCHCLMSGLKGLVNGVFTQPLGACCRMDPHLRGDDDGDRGELSSQQLLLLIIATLEYMRIITLSILPV